MVSGELVELDSEALRFRSWEVEELFRVVYGEPLSPEGAAALTRRTGGWAAGLMLFHLATSGKSTVERERAVARPRWPVPVAAHLPDADRPGRAGTGAARVPARHLHPRHADRVRCATRCCERRRERGGARGPGVAPVLHDARRERPALPLPPGAADPARGPPRRRARSPGGRRPLRAQRVAPRVGRAAAGGPARVRDGRGLRVRRAGAPAVEPGLAMDPQIAQADDRRRPVAGAGAGPAAASGRCLRGRRRGVPRGGGAERGARSSAADAPRNARWPAVAGRRDPPGPAGTRRSTGSRAAAQAVRAATRRLPAPDRLPRQPLAEGVVLLLAGDLGPRRPEARARRPGTIAEQLYADLARVVAEIVDAHRRRRPSRPSSRSSSPPRWRSSPGWRDSPVASRRRCSW